MAALMAWLLRPTTVAMAASLLTMVSHALVAPYTQASQPYGSQRCLCGAVRIMGGLMHADC
eukprot:5114531-Pleurochrysis_carterae.AAC.1